MSEKGHAEFSPSGADTWMVCAPALAMQRGEPNKSSQFADEGTDAHTLFAECLELGLLIGTPVKAEEHIGNILPKGTIVDSEFAAAVQISLDVVNTRIAMWEQLGYTVQLEIEQRVPIGHLTGEKDAEGTADVVLIARKGSDTKLEVIDLKFGRGIEVSAVENRQLKIYALGAIAKFSIDPGEIQLDITQPRINERPSEWLWRKEAALGIFPLVIKDAANAARHFFDISPNKIAIDAFNPGEKQCRFCRAKHKCQGLTAYVENAISEKFEVLDVNSIPTYTEALTAEDLGALFPKLEIVSLWVKAIGSKVNELLSTGVKVPNAKLVKGRKGARSWIDEMEAETLLKSMRLKHDQMYDYKLTSPTKLEKYLVNAPRKWKKVAALIVQSEAGNTVALESDPRPAVVITPIETKFENLTNEDLL